MDKSDVIKICSNLDMVLYEYGNINFLTKEDLYSLIDYIRTNFNININDVLNIPKFCKENFSGIINYDFHNFNDTKIGGFLVKNKLPEQSYIIVNTSKDSLCTLFDLTHEMIHFLLHPENRKHYISSSLCDIDNFEWQANEGAAELLVPYKKFIPYFVRNIKVCNSRKDYTDLLQHLSDKYKVSTAVLEYRISGLKYEISQYEKGIAIDKIQLLSKTAQEENGIFITPYNEIFRNKKTDIKSILKKFEPRKTTSYVINQPEVAIERQIKSTVSFIYSWEDIKNYFKSTGQIMLYTNLLNTEMLQIDNNTTSIKFSKDITPFCRAILGKEHNLKAIEEQVNKLHKKQMNIIFIDKTSTIIKL